MTISDRQAACVPREHAFTRTASEKQAAVASVPIGGSASVLPRPFPSHSVTPCVNVADVGPPTRCGVSGLETTVGGARCCCERTAQPTRRLAPVRLAARPTRHER
jgi:hypothetical protein